MAILELKQGTNVFYKNEQYKIVSIIDFEMVSIEHLQTKEVLNILISELSTKVSDIEEKTYIDEYTDDEWSEALERYEIIKDLVFTKRTKALVEQIAIKNNYSYVTLYEWIKLYENTEQISSLISKKSKRGKKGTRLNNRIENIITTVLDELYLNKQRYSIGRIYRKVCKQCKEQNLEVPHENTIRNRIKKLDKKEVVKKRHGYKEANKHFENYEGEFPEGEYPLDFVQIDHTPLDIRVVDSQYRQPIGRPHLTLAIDVYSRMIAGFYLSLKSPAYYNVSQCLYNVFIPKDYILKKYDIDGNWNIYGIPRVIGVDNGSDLVSKDMQRVCDEYNITLMKRPVARPQFGAHVERVFGTINKEIHNLSGTTFSNISAKGEYDSDKEAMYTIEELTEWLLHFIVNIYHKKFHHGIEMSPDKKYKVGIFGDEDNPGVGILPSIIEDVEDVKIALLPTEFRTVQKDGITLDGITYYSDVLRQWIGKKNDKNEKIKHKIKRDPMNIRTIYFFDSELKEYFEIPYRKLSAPVMTLWELYAVKRYLKSKNINDYTEDDIFNAYEILEEKENIVKNKHKEYHRQIKKKNMINKEEVSQKNGKKDLDSEHFDSLFTDIEIYDVTMRD